MSSLLKTRAHFEFCPSLRFSDLAEEVGFEPTVRFPPRLISSQVP